MKRSVRTAIYVMAAIVSLWGLAVIIVSCVQCVPLAGFWDKTIDFHGHCDVNEGKFFTGNAIPNILTDIALIFIPIVPICSLKIPLWQKLAVISIFLLGSLYVLPLHIKLCSIELIGPSVSLLSPSLGLFLFTIPTFKTPMSHGYIATPSFGPV